MHVKELSEARKLLERIRKIENEIHVKQERIAHLRALATISGSSMGGGTGSARATSRVESGSVSILDELARVEASRDELMQLRMTAADLINMVDDDQQRSLLELRYLCHKSWQEVQSEMYISQTSSFRLWRLAIASFERIYAQVGSKWQSDP